MARVEEDRKVLDDVQELVMVHRSLKSVSSVVQMIIGRVIVQRWMMVLRVRRNEILEPTHMGAWTCNNPDHSRDEKFSSDSFQVDPLCGAAISPVQDDDECEAHAAYPGGI